MARTITAIQADLDAFYAARRAVALGQTYQLDTGQGRQAVTRANLTEINRTIQTLETELSELVDGANPGVSFERYFS
jgi:hypothetical protein